MTTYEAISLVAQFGIVILALVGIIVDMQDKRKLFFVFIYSLILFL